MNKLKVMTVVGTRPEIIRLSKVVQVLEKVTDHILVHTGQNYDFELNQIFFQELKVNAPQHYLDAAGSTPAETIGNTIIKIDKILESESPDALLILGDTNSCLCAISAKRRKIPIFHMEAGNRCFDMRVPEEINRKIVDHTSDINLCYTEHARRNLLNEGLTADKIFKTGSPMKEVLDFHKKSIESSNIHNELNLRKKQYFCVSLHREENVDTPSRLLGVMGALDEVSTEYNYPIIFSVHPRTRKRLEAAGIQPNNNIIFSKPFGFFDFIALQKNAYCVLSDSGTITEESTILGFPAVTLRDAHERPEGMDEGAVVLTGISKDRILQGIHAVVTQHKEGPQVCMPADYDVEQVSWKVAKLIISYTDYVKRFTWRDLAC
jgi:UDP-N-acetylglucosamine 2-epimerase (non-hydrolysing)